jgi:hypothetical protein
MNKLIKAIAAFGKLHGGKEFRLLLMGLSGVAMLTSILAPELGAHCAVLGFVTNFLWIYGDC